MEVKNNHLKVGDFVVQYNDAYGDNRGFVVLDTTIHNAQIGNAYESLCEALEEVLKY